MMGVANSYTMEASFAGSTMGSRVDTHFNVQDFESMGRAFCETLLDFCDEDPSKERLRLKIIERLVKEGSSADEPTNINLSDYSSDEGDTSSSSSECGTRKDRKGDWATERFPLAHPVPVRPPSSTPPKKDSHIKSKARGSSAKATKKVVTEKTPPMPRKPLQVHRTTLDPPCLDQPSEGLDLTTEIESGEESSSWQKGSRKFKSDSRGKKIKKRHMPPELIVTPAQVYETAELSEKETVKGVKKSSPEFKRKNINPELAGEKFRLWHHAKCLQSQSHKSGKSISDLTTEVQLKLGTTLRQKIWTGCPCTSIYSDAPLSKGASPKFTHWSKGPLTWTSNIFSQGGTDNSGNKSFSQRLTIQQQQQNVPISEDGATITEKKKSKSWSKKTNSEINKSLSQREVDSDFGEYSKKSSKKKSTKFRKEKEFPSYNDPTTQVALLKLTDSKSQKSSKDNLNADDKVPTKSSKSARAKLRKSGFIVTAVSRYRYDTADSDSDGETIEKSVVKKKKKRKTTTAKKSKRLRSGKGLTETPSKIKDREK